MCSRRRKRTTLRGRSPTSYAPGSPMGSSSSPERMTSQGARVEVFHRLHASGCFVMPNPWDVGTAVALEGMGFKALATTSAGHAWTLGRADIGSLLMSGGQRVGDEDDRGRCCVQALEHLRALSAAVEVPLNADFEGGFADDPDDVAANVKLAVATG